MSECCGGNRDRWPLSDAPGAWFRRMIERCHEYALQAKAAGRPIVGILCEFTPREILMAAGAVPVCLCGGSAATIPAAEEHLPANLCPLIKSTYGYHLQRSNPLLEAADLIVAETTCDGKKKMYELMAQSRAMYVLELPQKAQEPESLERWVAELRKFRRFVESRWSVEAGDDKLRAAIAVMNRERALRRELAALQRADPPPMTGRDLLDFKSSISGIPADLEQYARALALFRARGPNAELAGRPRVLLTGVPIVHGAERVLEIIENGGGVVVAMENCTALKPILEDVDAAAADPLRAIAEKYFHLPCSVMTPNERRLDSLRRLAADYRPDCVVDLVWQACLTYDVESHLVKRLVEQELGLGYLRIETDYSPSDTARIAVRVEALLETVGQRRPGRSSRCP
jgi:benzoyl-CoA reductase/2-hydroxyglutaryl-CoA dehydratase subunit BcrC/BadD/HgdB